MIRLIGAACALWMMVMAQAAVAFGPLTEPAELSASDGAAPLILDIRAPKDFAAGHVPGAVNTPYGGYRGPKDNPGRVPSDAALQDMLRAAGATKDRPVLVVHQGKNATDFGAAARVYWTLKSAGFEGLSILNGGYDGWVAAGNTPGTEAVAPIPSTVEIVMSDAWMMDRAGVSAVVSGDAEAVLLDARPLEFFKGEKKHGAAKTAGTLAGALNIVHDTWFQTKTPRVDAPADMIARIKEIAAEKGDRPLVSFCNTGHWAATNWFAASELAGIENVKLYPESMVGWTALGMAVVNGG